MSESNSRERKTNENENDDRGDHDVAVIDIQDIARHKPVELRLQRSLHASLPTVIEGLSAQSLKVTSSSLFFGKQESVEPAVIETLSGCDVTSKRLVPIFRRALGLPGETN